GSTFAAAGISTAVTRMVTDELACGSAQSVRRVLSRAVQLSVVIGIASAAVIYLAADAISLYWIKDIRAAQALKALTVGLPFMGISSCFKGYFVARRRISGASRAQLLEQAVRIGVIMLIIDRFAGMGLASACLAVMIADTVAEISSCVYLAAGYLLDKRRLTCSGNPAAKAPAMKKLLGIAAPITAGRYLNTTLRTIENILVPDCLARFLLSKEQGLSQFGMLKGMAMPLLFFPSSFLSALSMLLVPEISEAAALKQKKRVNTAVVRTLHLTLTASALIGCIFFVFSDELGRLFYKSPEVGFLLKVLAPLLPVMYLESVIDGILKGLNQQVSSLIYSFTDSVIRIVLIVLLVPAFGMPGFLFVMVISNLLTSLLNLHRLLKVTEQKMQWYRWVTGPLLAAAAGGGLAYYLRSLPQLNGLPLLLRLIAGAVVITAIYAGLLAVMGCLPKFKREKPVLKQDDYETDLTGTGWTFAGAG
ncbi:MAG: oligosaccharide flippase family protein, partial [Oscillospiraceae bacterium]|nr:oligosaccharide flippase family protein [Oscillospiraceae bacterium]